jgi:hypothetical protein
MAPRVLEHPGARPTATKEVTVDASKSSAPYAHPSTEDHDDTVEAHYSCLERPCACMDGRVFVGYVDEYGEERQVSSAAAAARTVCSPVHKRV